MLLGTNEGNRPSITFNKRSQKATYMILTHSLIAVHLEERLLYWLVVATVVLEAEVVVGSEALVLELVLAQFVASAGLADGLVEEHWQV